MVNVLGYSTCKEIVKITKQRWTGSCGGNGKRSAAPCTPSAILWPQLVPQILSDYLLPWSISLFRVVGFQVVGNGGGVDHVMFVIFCVQILLVFGIVI